MICISLTLFIGLLSETFGLLHFEEIVSSYLSLIIVPANSCSVNHSTDVVRNVKRNSHNISRLTNVSTEFLQWFVGFADGESCFQINSNKKGINFYFRFRIELHIDDIAVLEFIQKTLNVGAASAAKKTAIFSVNKLEDPIHGMLPIFDSFPHHSVMVLDFLDFKKAVSIAQIKNNDSY